MKPTKTATEIRATAHVETGDQPVTNPVLCTGLNDPVSACATVAFATWSANTTVRATDMEPENRTSHRRMTFHRVVGRRPVSLKFGGCLIVALGLLGITGTTPAGAQETPTTVGKPRTVTVTVKGTDSFADSGVKVRAGDAVEITADGEIVYRRDQAVTGVGPDGIALARCLESARPGEKRLLPVPGQPCWSLVGKIGAKGKPFGIGSEVAFKARASGPLLLGINDGVTGDNRGAWKAKITVTPAVAPPPVVADTDDGGSSSILIPIVLGAVVLVLAALLFLFLKRRKRGDDEDSTRAPVQEEALVAASVGAAAVGPGFAPFNPESAEVYIFRVAFDDGALDVGYNFLPAGTAVTWRVLDSGVELAAGTFAAEGGGSEQHVARLPLGDAIANHDEPVDVAFTWSINDVPFGYSVRRDPRSMTTKEN
jgi:hypothetical protein